ncbi:hypothetical protein QKD39_gp18 [Psittacine adenovirus 1]|uniref:Uncharacterized protein n=1 Tax=Psittacine adenovirus 1 TaxID=318592 RepID=A0A2Z5E027_9ADEN|nr:hypothetical protein QKD39_gp18 [Psittacine adenovirus 1]AXB73006.1 hypothetical protein [Psittacine adenovirus 1]
MSSEANGYSLKHMHIYWLVTSRSDYIRYRSADTRITKRMFLFAVQGHRTSRRGRGRTVDKVP